MMRLCTRVGFTSLLLRARFWKNRIVDRARVGPTMGLDIEATNEIFGELAEKTAAGWELKLPTDFEIAKKYPEIAASQNVELAKMAAQFAKDGMFAGSSPVLSSADNTEKGALTQFFLNAFLEYGVCKRAFLASLLKHKASQPGDVHVICILFANINMFGCIRVRLYSSWLGQERCVQQGAQICWNRNQSARQWNCLYSHLS